MLALGRLAIQRLRSRGVASQKDRRDSVGIGARSSRAGLVSFMPWTNSDRGNGQRMTLTVAAMNAGGGGAAGGNVRSHERCSWDRIEGSGGWQTDALAHLHWRKSAQPFSPFHLIRPEQHDRRRAELETTQFCTFFQVNRR